MFKKLLILFTGLLLCTAAVRADELSDFFGSDIAGGGLVSTSLTSAELQEYSIKAGTKIINNFKMPQTSQNYSTLLIFKVDKNGKLLKYEISQSSGNADYDARVIDAVKKSSPYPPANFQQDGDLTLVLNMDLSIIRLIKMLSTDLNLNELLNQSGIQKQAPAQKQYPTGKKFVNPSAID